MKQCGLHGFRQFSPKDLAHAINKDKHLNKWPSGLKGHISGKVSRWTCQRVLCLHFKLYFGFLTLTRHLSGCYVRFNYVMFKVSRSVYREGTKDKGIFEYIYTITAMAKNCKLLVKTDVQAFNSKLSISKIKFCSRFFLLNGKRYKIPESLKWPKKITCPLHSHICNSPPPPNKKLNQCTMDSEFHNLKKRHYRNHSNTYCS